MSVGNGEMSAGDETGAERHQEQRAGEEQGSYRGPAGNVERVGTPGRVRVPVNWRGLSRRDAAWNWVGHGVFSGWRRRGGE